MNAGFVGITRKANVLPKNANAALTSMFVQVEKNPVKIITKQTELLTKIQTLEEFKQIKNADFGFIVISDDTAATLHQSKCANLREDEFPNCTHHWFSTLTLAEKSFNVVICNVCKPE